MKSLRSDVLKCMPASWCVFFSIVVAYAVISEGLAKGLAQIIVGAGFALLVCFPIVIGAVICAVVKKLCRF